MNALQKENNTLIQKQKVNMHVNEVENPIWSDFLNNLLFHKKPKDPCQWTKKDPAEGISK